MFPDWISALVYGLVASAALSYPLERFLRRPQSRQALHDDLDATLSALKTHSERATSLLAALQAEVGKRTTTVHALETELEILRQQRSLLELTPDQRQAIEVLVRRPASARQILGSKDFWLGRVLPGTVFFALGLIARRLLG